MTATLPGAADRLVPRPPAGDADAALADAALADAVQAFLRKAPAAAHGEVATDLATRAVYASDASNYRVPPAAVATPRDADDLAAMVALAVEAGLPLTMRGAGTSIAGNAIGRGLVIDTRRHLSGILDLDPVGLTATVLPGTVLDDINVAAARHGLRVGPDPSTHNRATVGGMAGNDACGSHSVRWGTTAENVLGLEVITTDGVRRRVGDLRGASGARLATRGPALATETAIAALLDGHGERIRAELPPWPRRVSGYHLDWLLPERGGDIARALVGTEGTCAVVSAVTLRLVRPPAAKVLLVLTFPGDIAAAAAVPALLAERPFTVESLTADLLVRPAPSGLLPEGGAWLLVEAGGETLAEAREHARRLARTVGTAPGHSSTLVHESPAAQGTLWRIREDGAGRSSRLPNGTPAWPGFEDAAVPPERLAGYLTALRALLRDRGLQGITYGHFGEGCIHLRVAFGLDRAGGTERLGGFMDAAADLVVAHGGTLSGEHGDGRARGEHLAKQFSPEMLSAFRAWKQAWDPRGALNPGIVVNPVPVTEDLRRPRPTLIALDTSHAFSVDAGDARSAIERCIGVGKCVSLHGDGLLCPSYRATGEERHSTRGRARLLQEMAAGILAPGGWRSAEVREALDLCLGCRACLTDCPTGVDMAAWKAEFLDHHYRGRVRPRIHYSLGRLPDWLRLVRRVRGGVRLVNAVTGFAPTRRLVAAAAGLAAERRIPALAPRAFTASAAGARFRAAGAAAPSTDRPLVLLWPDTFTNHLAPQVADAAVRVVEAAGFTVWLPAGDICCGLTRITTGQLDGARRTLTAALDTLERTGLPDAPILVLEPSCAATLRHDLPELLPDDPRARAAARRVTTLAELLGAAGGTPHQGERIRAIVQPHCHAQAVLGTDAERRLLAEAGIDADPMLGGCCGLAGTFGVEVGHEQITRDVAELNLLPALRAAADAPVIADGFSCRTQVAFLDGREARHLAEVLAERLAPPG